MNGHRDRPVSAIVGRFAAMTKALVRATGGPVAVVGGRRSVVRVGNQFVKVGALVGPSPALGKA